MSIDDLCLHYRITLVSILTLLPFVDKCSWMICDFMCFSTVFQLYQDNGWMIMIGCVQWNPVYSSRAQTRDHYISTPVLTPLSYWSYSVTGTRTNRVHAYGINWNLIFHQYYYLPIFKYLAKLYCLCESESMCCVSIG